MPATKRASYAPPFTVFSLQHPRMTDWDVVVTPDAGVDVNLLAWARSSTDSSRFPSRTRGGFSVTARNHT